MSVAQFGTECVGTCLLSFFGGGGGAVGRLHIATMTGNYNVGGATMSAVITTTPLQLK